MLILQLAMFLRRSGITMVSFLSVFCINTKGICEFFSVYLVHKPHSSQSNNKLEIFGLFDSLYKVYIDELEKLG